MACFEAPIYGPLKDNETRSKVFDRLYELGCTNWDTADGYGDSEDMIGQWFTRTGKREDVSRESDSRFYELTVVTDILGNEVQYESQSGRDSRVQKRA